MSGRPPIHQPSPAASIDPQSRLTQGDSQLRQRGQTSQTQTQTQQRGGMGPGRPGVNQFPQGRPPAQVPAVVVEATTPQLLVPSYQAVYALLMVPLVLWVAAVGLGMLHEEALPAGLSKHEFEHPLIWFDRHIFRVWGPLLPLAPLILRSAALFLPARSPVRGPPGRRPASGEGLRPPRPGATLLLQSLLVYGIVIVVRIGLYVSHVSLQQASRVALVSDHLLLGASVVACFQAELVLCLSDVFKVELLRDVDPLAAVRQGAVCTAMVMSMFLLVFLYGDMYCTARWYHDRPESLGALLAGGGVFQAPVVLWLLWHARRAPKM